MARSTWFVVAAIMAAVALLGVAVGVRIAVEEGESIRLALVSEGGGVRFVKFNWDEGVVGEAVRFPDADDAVEEVLLSGSSVVMRMASGDVRVVSEDRLVAEVVWSASDRPAAVAERLVSLDSGWGFLLPDGTYRRVTGGGLRAWVPAPEIDTEAATSFEGLVVVASERRVQYFEVGDPERRREVDLPFGFDPVRIHRVSDRILIQSRGGAVANHDLASGVTSVVDNSAARWRRTPIGPGGWSAVSLSDDATVLIQDGVRTIAYQSSRLAQSVHGRPDLVVLTFADGAVVVVDPEQRRQPVAVLPGEVDAVWAGVLANET